MIINVKKMYIPDIEKRVNDIMIKIKGGVCHETANPGATAMGHYNWIMNNPDVETFANFYVDWKEVLQFAETSKMLYHCKGGNEDYFGVELCRPAKHDVEKFNKVWENGTKLFAQIFLLKGINEVNEITLPSHNDITVRKKIKGGHTDPIAFFKEYGKTMHDFRVEVIRLMNLYKGKI